MLKTKKNQIILTIFLAILFFIVLGMSTKVNAAANVVRTYFAYPGTTIDIVVDNSNKNLNKYTNVYTKTTYDKSNIASGNGWKYNPSKASKKGSVTIAKDAQVNKTYYVLTYKNGNDEQWTEINVVPTCSLEDKNDDQIYEIYSEGKEKKLSSMRYTDKVIKSHRETIKQGNKNKRINVIDQERTETVTFKSSNPASASVDENGKVTLKKGGDVTVTMTRTITDTHYDDENSYTAVSILTTTNSFEIGYYINYNAKGGKNAPDRGYYFASSDKIKISDKQPTREGYKFLGWSTDKNAKTPSIKAGVTEQTNSWKKGGEKTLYAVWQKNDQKQETSTTKIYTNKLKVGNKLKINSGNSWWTYTKHTGEKLSTGTKYVALKGGDKVQILEIDGNWLKVKIVSLSSNLSKKNFKVGDVYYIYYGSTASKYITTIK